jgi:hypothetical protein
VGYFILDVVNVILGVEWCEPLRAFVGKRMQKLAQSANSLLVYMKSDIFSIFRKNDCFRAF